MPVIIALERLRQEVYKFEASLGYTVSSRPAFIIVTLSLRKPRDGDVAQWYSIC
jgi:hypothetical protein